MTACSGCGTQNPSSKKFCTACGQILPIEKKETSKNPTLESVGNMFSSFGFSADKKTASPEAGEAAPAPAPDPEPSTVSPEENVAQPPPGTRAEALKLVAKAGSKAILKSVALSALVLGPGFLMLMAGMPFPGMIWLFCGSFGLMAWTYRKPWRLGLVSCLIPPVAAAVCYLIQLALFGNEAPPIELLAPAIAVGIGVGYWRAQTHKVSKGEDGGIIAERTIGYLLVWVAAYAVTQMLGLVTRDLFAIRAGLVTGAFSTAMLAVVSIMIWRQFQLVKSNASAVILIAVSLGAMTGWANESRADNLSDLRVIADQVKPKLAEIADSIPKTRNCISKSPSSRVATRLNSNIHEFGYALRCNVSANNRKLVTRLLASLTIGNRNNRERLARTRKLARSAQSSSTRQAARTPNSARYYYQSGRFGDGSVVQYFVSRQQNTESGGVHCRIDAILNGWEARISVDHILGKAYAISDAPSCILAKRGMAVLMDAIASRAGRQNTVPPATQRVVPRVEAPTRIERPIPPEPERTAITPEEAAAVSAAIAAVLIAAGIAVNVAQAIAAAIANALQAGVQLTSEEIQAAIADALLNRDGTSSQTGPAEPDTEPDSNAPPNVTLTERVRPPRNTPGTESSGANGKGTPSNDESGSDTSSGKPTKPPESGQEQTGHQQQTAPSGGNEPDGGPDDAAQEADDKARRDAAARQAEDKAREARREALLSGVLHTINDMPPDERSGALMGQLADAHESGELSRAQSLWEEVRGERKDQIEDRERLASRLNARAVDWDRIVTLTELNRDLAKIQATMTAAAAAPVIGFVGAATAGAIPLVPIGMAEEGQTFDPGTGKIKVDGNAVGRGALKGGKSAAQAAMGGLKAPGWLARSGRATINAGLDGYEAYSDGYRTTYDKVLAKGGTPEAARLAAEKAAAEKGKYGVGVSLVNSAVNEAIGIRAGNRQVDLRGSALGRDQLITEGAKSAGGILVGTAQNVALKDQDLHTALGGAARQEILNRVAQGTHVAAGVETNPLSGFSQDDTAQTATGRRQTAAAADAESAGSRGGDGDATSRTAAASDDARSRAPTAGDVADAEAAHRRAQSGRWRAEQELASARERLAGLPDHQRVSAEIDLKEAEGRLGSAKGSEFSAALDAQDIYQAHRSGTAPGPDFSDAAPPNPDSEGIRFVGSTDDSGDDGRFTANFSDVFGTPKKSD